MPGNGTAALYIRIDESHVGTLDDPIPYSGNMILESGKYYIQDHVIYLCNRDTGTRYTIRWRSWWGCMWRQFNVCW